MRRKPHETARESAVGNHRHRRSNRPGISQVIGTVSLIGALESGQLCKAAPPKG